MLPKSKKIIIKGKEVTVHTQGNGAIPCMFVGAAGLFRKPGMLPESLNKTLTFYFLDLWETVNRSGVSEPDNYSGLNWDEVVDEIEEGRKKLELEKVVIMGQSAAGAMPIEYARKYPAHCLLVVPVAFSPLWTEKLAAYRDKFIKGEETRTANASEERQRLITDLDLAYTSSVAGMSPEEAFVARFTADRPLYWKDYETAGPKINFMWQDYRPNVNKVKVYVTRLLNGYDFFSNPLEKVPMLWCLGIYDYSVPIPLFTDALETFKKSKKLNNVDYYIFTSGHYPMVEVPKEFAAILQATLQDQLSAGYKNLTTT